MSGTMRASFCFSATRTLTVALPRSAVGMIAITSAGIFQSGIGVERGLDRHLRLHAADEGFADVDFHFQRIHVDDGADAGAGEAAAGRQRRDDLARLRGLGDHHAGERRAHDGVVDAHGRRCAGGRRRPARCAARWSAARAAHRAGRRPGRTATCDTSCCFTSRRRRAALASASRSCACTLPIWLCAAPTCEAARSRCGVGVDRIERGHDLAGLDALAFLDQHLAHLAGDLRRHRGHAPRDDVAGGVEHRGGAAAVPPPIGDDLRGFALRSRLSRPNSAHAPSEHREQRPRRPRRAIHTLSRRAPAAARCGRCGVPSAGRRKLFIGTGRRTGGVWASVTDAAQVPEVTRAPREDRVAAGVDAVRPMRSRRGGHLTLVMCFP